MKSRLNRMQDEHRQLSDRLAELEAEKKEIRARMVADPLHTAPALANSFAQRDVQIEVLTEKLGQVKRQIEAEEARINSPEVQKGIKRAEKLISENEALCKKLAAQLLAALSETNEAIQKMVEAEQLLSNGGRENRAAMGNQSLFFSHAKNHLDSWNNTAGTSATGYMKKS